jgi:hypothetical protein
MIDTDSRLDEIPRADKMDAELGAPLARHKMSLATAC